MVSERGRPSDPTRRVERGVTPFGVRVALYVAEQPDSGIAVSYRPKRRLFHPTTWTGRRYEVVYTATRPGVDLGETLERRMVNAVLKGEVKPRV